MSDQLTLFAPPPAPEQRHVPVPPPKLKPGTKEDLLEDAEILRKLRKELDLESVSWR